MIPDIRIRWNGVKVRLRGFGLRKLQHLQILEVGLKSMKARLAGAIDQNDAPTKPLTKRYAIRKTRAGKGNRRDLRLTGALLDGIKPRYADDFRAVADATGRLGRIKARIYRDLLKFSPRDQVAMGRISTVLFKQNVQTTLAQLTPNGARASRFSRATPAARDSRPVRDFPLRRA